MVHGGGWCGQCGHSPNTGGPSEVATLSSFLPTVSATESSSTLDLDITESSHSSSSLLGSNSAETFKILRHLSRSMNLSPVTLPSERFIRVQNIGIHQLISNSSHTPPETQENKHYWKYKFRIFISIIFLEFVPWSSIKWLFLDKLWCVKKI